MRSTNNIWRLVAGISLIVLVVAWSLALLHSHDVREKTHADAGRRMAAIADAYATHARLSLTVADETLQRLQETLSREGEAAFSRTAQIVSREDTNGGLNRAALIGADGHMRANFLSGELAPLLDVNDREYFLTLRNNPDKHIYISEPIRGKASGKWIILFARPVLSDGRFAGVIFVGLETNSLGGLVKTAENNGELITLLSPGWRIIARSLAATDVVGTIVDLPKHTPESGKPFVHTSPIDGITRLSATHSVPGWGMRIIAGVDLKKLENEIAAHNRIAIIPALLLTLLLIPAALLVRRALFAQQAAEQTRRSEAARLRRVLESMSEGVLLIDPDDRISFANAAAQDWLSEPVGQPFKATLGASGLSLVTEDGVPFTVTEPLEPPGLHSGIGREGAWLLDSTRQQARWLALRCTPLFNIENGISGTIATLVDRSDEHERITEAEMSKTVLARMSDAVLITDAQTTIRMVNAAFSRISGFSEEETIGKKPAFLRSDRHNEAFWADVWQTLKQNGNWSGKVWNRHKNGSEYCVWHTITAVHDMGGRIARYVAVSRDITKQQALETDLWQRANFDPLTGLANRTRFEDRLAQIVDQVARHKHAFAVCYLDFDCFKPVNDTLGHAAGDAVLRQAAQRMRAIVRKDDTLARIGGDEFALLMPRLTASEDATLVAEKIISALNVPFVVAEGSAQIGVSIGIAIYPEHGNDAVTLISQADHALYRAKAEGRNVWRFAETDTRNKSPEQPVDA